MRNFTKEEAMPKSIEKEVKKVNTKSSSVKKGKATETKKIVTKSTPKEKTAKLKEALE